MAASFSFVLDSFQITSTRSLLEDTDYVSFTLVVNPQGGQGTPLQTQVKSMGSINNGSYSVSLSFDNVPVNPTDTVVFNYLIYNSSIPETNARVMVEETMEAVGVDLSKITTVSIPPSGSVTLHNEQSSLLPLQGWLLGEFNTLILAGGGLCDGTVAAEQDTYTGEDLLAKTASGQFSQKTVHNGSSSPVGCGGNSTYIVNWHMLNTSTTIVPNVYELTEAQAQVAIKAVGLVAVFSTAKQISSPKVTATSPWVFSQSPVAGTSVAPGSTVTMVLHTGPLP
jgi:PASTA domain